MLGFWKEIGENSKVNKIDKFGKGWLDDLMNFHSDLKSDKE